MSLKSYNTIKPASVALLYACDHAMLHYCNSKILFRHPGTQTLQLMPHPPVVQSP